MPVTTEQQIAEWEKAATDTRLIHAIAIDVGPIFRKAIPALIADLREARAKLAELDWKYFETIGGTKRDLQRKLSDQREKNARQEAKLAEAEEVIRLAKHAIFNLTDQGARADGNVLRTIQNYSPIAAQEKP